ncbi:MAG TPA: histidinol dehydrogenase, partial [Isosphaeraceae bacterium]|nr:histidinol dehydrogenase [Isosphaeraceae bacterium]
MEVERVTLGIRQIDCARDDAERAIAALRAELSPKGNVVSPEGRARTIAAFGEPLEPRQVVERICEDVSARGLAAVLDYTRRLDGVTLEANQVRVSDDELRAAHRQADPGYLETLARIRDNILAYQKGILPSGVRIEPGPGVELGLLYRPIRRVGVCIPGGAAAYPSTLLMTVVPAQAAGVGQIAVVVPPTPFGGFNADLLAACAAMGLSEVYRVGGAQGIAALAYGIDAIGLEPVDKIVGPGNLFVALAKRHVYGQVAIDCIAGPSEVVVMADDSAPPAVIAAELIAQSEHAPGAGILVTSYAGFADAVEAELGRQLAGLERGEQARESLEQFGATVLTRGDD